MMPWIRIHRFLIVVPVLLCFVPSASGDPNKEASFLQDLGHAFVDGIVQSNFRELPADELFPLFETPLPSFRVPKTNQHPSLLFSRDALPQMRMRQSFSPYAEWADHLIAAANQQMTDVSSPLVSEIQRSESAKLNAFAYVLTGQTVYLEQAADALNAIGEPNPIHSIEGGQTDVGWGDWMQAADALARYCVAYDLLYAELPASVRSLVETRLADQANQLFRALPLVPKNNHAVVIASGLGTAALTLPNGARQQWLDAAMDQLKSALRLIEPDGSYREGAYYARFVASRLFPFFFYLYNITEVNLFRHQRIVRLNRWLADIALPNGGVPDFDDAFPEQWIYEPITIGLAPESGRLNALFQDRISKLDPEDPAWVEAFCAYRPQISFDQELHAATFYPYGGMSVFRGDHDVYGLLLGEPGRPHLVGHDHVEPTGFTLYAFGKPWLLDGGYGRGGASNPDRAYFVSSDAHNLPLINGLGPDENPVWGDDPGGKTIHTFEVPGLASATVRARYRETDVERQVYFVDGRYFLIADQLISSSPQRYTIPWHGLGDGQKVSDQSVRWQQENACLDGYFLRSGNSPLSIVSKPGLHTVSGQSGSHTQFSVDLPPATTGQLVSLFIPQSKEASEIRADLFPVLSSEPAQAWQLVTADQIRPAWLVLSDSDWQVGDLKSDGHMVLFQERDMETPPRLTMIGGTYFEYHGLRLIESTQPVTCTLVLDESGWFGYIRPTSHNTDSLFITFATSFQSGQILIDHREATYIQTKEGIRVHVASAGIFEMGHGLGKVRTTETWRPNQPVIDRLSTAGDVPAALDHLSSEDRILLKNEITETIGREILAQINTRSGHDNGLQNLYLIASGLANAAINRLGLDLALPQQLKLQENFGNHQFDYFEEGYFSQKGWTLQRQQLDVDDALFLSYNQPFAGYEEGALSYYQPTYQLQTRVERTSEDMGYDTQWTGYRDGGWLSFQHQKRLDDGVTSGVGMGAGNWSGNMTLLNTNREPVSAFFRGQHRTRMHHTVFQLTAEEGRGLQSATLESGWRIHPSLYCQVGWSGTNLDHENEANRVRSQLWFSRASLNGWVSTLKDEDGAVSGKWQGNYRSGAYLFSSFGTYGHRATSQWGVTRMDSHLSWQARLYGLESFLGQCSVRLNEVWSLTTGGRVQFEDGDWLSRTAGLTYQNQWLVGGQLRLVRSGSQTLHGATGVLGVPLGCGEHVHCYVSWLDDPAERSGYYEIQLSQIGKHRTPGLLLYGNDEGVERLEGYLKWTF